MYIGALNMKQNSTSLSSFGMRSIFEYSKFDHWTFYALPLGEPALLPHVSACFVARLKG